MHQKRNIPFKIENIDSLGQGVSKATDKITFIPKTLPGEIGVARILAQKKSVQFAEAIEISEPAAERISPDCIHFNQCPSCHFLHTSYEMEINFKLLNLERLFNKIEHPPIKVIGAIRRNKYRNRLQLHFDTKNKKLGMLDAKNQQIAPIPQCLIAVESVKKELNRLYQDNNWLNLIPKDSPSQGHLEIYERDGKINVTVNRPYADGGFTQVFHEMNLVLQDLIKNELNSEKTTELIDLFAGDGNLSNNLNHSKRLCVDYYSRQVSSPFLSVDLYGQDAIKIVRDALNNQKISPQLLILDPPRSGLKNFQDWLHALQPQKVAYVSCDPHTLVRDLLPLDSYFIKGVQLVDLFPSTFHFETVVFLERK